jgi:hypothetical protein
MYPPVPQQPVTGPAPANRGYVMPPPAAAPAAGSPPAGAGPNGTTNQPAGQAREGRQMERVQSLIRAAVGAAILVAAPGCMSPPKTSPASPDPQTGAASVPAAAKADGHVKQASASVPSFQMPSLAKLTGKDKPGLPASLVVVGWRKRIEYLPDPTPGRNGAMNPGLVGEMFLIAANGQFAAPDGPVTVELFDETPRPGRDPARPPKVGQWRFERDVLKQLATPHEWFGKCYALFLPWPEYRPDVAKVRVIVKYEPERGIPLYAEPSTVVIDNGAPVGQSVMPAAGPPTPLGWSPPANLAGFGAGVPTLPAGGLPQIGMNRMPGQ